MNYKCYQGNVDKAYLNQVKSEAIPQANSSAINKALVDAEKAPLNLRNVERLSNHSAGKGNLLIKGPENLSDFNAHVTKIKEIDPSALKNIHTLH